jgi:hypothetical protein
VRRLPADSQNDIARTILHLAGSELEPEPVDPAHLATVLEGLAQAKRREFATDDEIEAAFRRFERFTPRATRGVAEIAEIFAVRR